MTPSLRHMLVGRERPGHRRVRWSLLAVALFGGTLAAYAVGVFDVTGGVVFVPAQAALVGLLAAGVVGYARDGPGFAWLVCYGALLGARADHAFLGLSSRPLAERLAYFVRLDGLFAVAVEALVLGAVAFALGALVRQGNDALRPLDDE